MRGQWMGLLLTLLSFSAHAQIFTTGAGRVVVSGDTGVFTVDEITRDADGWPQLLRLRLFSNREQAEAFAKGAFPKRQEVNVFDDGGAVLKGVGIPLWNATQTWDWSWEKKFADWIRADIDKDFFVRYKLATDCADVAYALRWIFARENGLPMSTRLASGDWFNQKTMRAAWLKLPVAKEWYNDKRFRAALDYVLDFTYTHTLAQDAYPTAVNPDAILEGGFHLELHVSMGHTQPLTRVRRPGESGLPLYILDSTIPRAVRPLHSGGYWVYQSPKLGHGGLMRFRWPDSSGRGLISAKKMPFYSEEQYSPAFRNPDETAHFLAVFRRLAPGLTIAEIAAEMFTSIRDSAEQRAQVVNDGYQACLTADCTPGTAAYENWSTPSRDARLESLLTSLDEFVTMIPGADGAALRAQFATTAITLDGTPFSFAALQWAWVNKTISSDPRLTVARRWGLQAAPLNEHVRETARAGWLAREQFLATASSCSASLCTPGSEEWKKRSSSEVDSTLLRLVRLTERYCEIAPFQECAAFGAYLDSEFDLRNPQWTLRRTISSFIAMLNDPRLPADVRRDGRVFNPVLLPSAPLAETSSSFMRIGENGTIGILDLRGPVPRELLAAGGLGWLGVNLEKSRAWYKDASGKTYMRDLLNGQEIEIALGFVPDNMIADAQSAIFVGKGHWAAIDSGGLVRTRGEYDSLLVQSSQIFIRKNGGTFVLELAANGASVFQVDLPSSQSFPERVTSTRLGWLYTLNGHPTLLHRSGKRIDYPDLDHVILMTRDGRDLYGTEGMVLKLYTLGDEGEILNEERPRDFQSNFGNAVAFPVNGVMTLHRLRDGQLDRVPVLPGEMMIYGVTGELVVGMSTGGSHVRRRDGTHLYEVAKDDFVQRIHGDSGFITVCTLPTAGGGAVDYSSICRLENVFRPNEFSFLTGLSAAFEEWMLRDFRMDRGVRVFTSGRTLWAEF